MSGKVIVQILRASSGISALYARKINGATVSLALRHSSKIKSYHRTPTYDDTNGVLPKWRAEVAPRTRLEMRFSYEHPSRSSDADIC